MSQAPKFNITATHGTLWRRVITLRSKGGTPLDLTGSGALFQVRSDEAASTNLVEASTDEGSITVGGTDGTVTIELDPGQLTFTPGTYSYGLALIDSQGRLNEPILEGAFILRKGLPRR